MKIWMEAYIKWVPPEEDGRKEKLPDNTRYCPIIVFPGTETDGTWSADIFVNSGTDKGESRIDISFLASEAPFALLQPGARFELYEGRRLVAKGIVGNTQAARFSS